MAPPSRDLTRDDGRLWGYLKSQVYGSRRSNLLELKDGIHRGLSCIHVVVSFVTRLRCGVSARTIRRRLQLSGQSARRPLLGLPLTQNHRRLRRQWGDERRMWAVEWKEVVFTDESRMSSTQRWSDSSLETP
ncbi:transposable element Tcb1 transposase [Trichonephila clavipes]|nr:transposable element Tcb1 transposase [Trichonephila clavipes]